MAKTGSTGLCELANITDGENVTAIHREYISCGVDAIKTNTFRANAEVFPDAATLTNVIGKGYKLAQKAAEGTNAEVYADIGYAGDGDSAESLYLQTVNIFLSLGATNFLFETLSSFNGIAASAERIKSQSKNTSVIVSFSVSQDGYSSKGFYYKQLIKEAAECPFTDAVGLNCVCGPAHLLNLTRGLTDISKPLSIMPNAGYPAVINGRTVFNDNAKYFGERLLELSKLGVEITGGCCGTTPEHIKQARKIILSFNTHTKSAAEEIRVFPRERQEDVLERPDPRHARTEAVEKRPPAARGNMPANPRLRLKPIYVELDPPLDGDSSFLLDSVEALKRLGVSAFTLADSPLSRPRADSVLTAAHIMSQKRVDVLPHITCRDKNAVALKGSLLGAYAFGIDKVLIVTGDRPSEDGVFSFNSIKLIAYINNLNKEIFGKRPFSVGAALNVNAVNFDTELNRARQKIINGAGFLLTQPIFSESAVENFIRSKNELNCQIYAGILPVVSYKNAVFLNNEVAGIKIPEHIVEAFKDKKNAAETSFKMSTGTVQAVYGHADGFYIMTPLKKTGLVCALIERCFNV